MKILAFDLEIARDLDRISFEEFRPTVGEKIEVDIGIKPDEITWRQGTYEGDGTFAIPEKTFDVEGLCWHPVENKDWKRFRPLGITCAAAASSDGGLWNWYAQDSGKFTDKMSEVQCWNLVKQLNVLVHEGYTPLTWNGLGFDFGVLAEESADDMNFCKELALSHIDMMFHFFCSKGFPLGLDKACKGMGLPGKPEGMDGAIAPRMWANGEYHRVLDYVSWDGKNTLALAQAVDHYGYLEWISNSGRPNSWSRHSEWLTVKEAMALPKPYTSWMTDPWPRSKFYGWTGYEPDPKIPPGEHHKDADCDIDYDEMEEEERREIE